MRILHILRNSPDNWTKEAIDRHMECFDVTILLIQDAVLTEEKFPGPVLALDEDAGRRTPSIDWLRIDYTSIVRLLFEHDRVICW